MLNQSINRDWSRLCTALGDDEISRLSKTVAELNNEKTQLNDELRRTLLEQESSCNSVLPLDTAARYSNALVVDSSLFYVLLLLYY